MASVRGARGKAAHEHATHRLRWTLGLYKARQQTACLQWDEDVCQVQTLNHPTKSAQQQTLVLPCSSMSLIAHASPFMTTCRDPAQIWFVHDAALSRTCGCGVVSWRRSRAWGERAARGLNFVYLQVAACCGCWWDFESKHRVHNGQHFFVLFLFFTKGCHCVGTSRGAAQGRCVEAWARGKVQCSL